MTYKQHYTGIFYDGNRHLAACVTFEDAATFGPLGAADRMTVALNEAGYEWDVIALVAVAPEADQPASFGEAIADDTLFEPHDPEGQPVQNPMPDVIFKADGTAQVEMPEDNGG